MAENLRAIRLLLVLGWREAPSGMVFAIVEGIVGVSVLWMAVALRQIADAVDNGDAGHPYAWAAILVLALALGLGVAVYATVARMTGNEKLGFVVDRELNSLVTGLPGLSHLENPEVQDRFALLREGQGALGEALNSMIWVANSLLRCALLLATVAWVDPLLLLLAMLAFPAGWCASRGQRISYQRQLDSEPDRRRALQLHALTYSPSAGAEIRLFGLGEPLLERMTEAWSNQLRIRVAGAWRSAGYRLAAQLLFLAGFVFSVAVTVFRAADGQATVGDVLLVVTLANVLQASLLQTVQITMSTGFALRSVRQLLWLREFAVAEQANWTGADPAPSRLVRGIELDRVSFRYPGARDPALDDVSLILPAGHVVALVGENGSGKTTLVKLLTRCYNPDAGIIRVDGADLRSVEVESWRERVTAAFQDFARLELAASPSVGVGHLPRIDDPEALSNAADRAGATAVLDGLPSGWQTQLGSAWEGGVDLSVGQWQKLALARAYMRADPLVVFFDEPTASLDAPTEEALFARVTTESRAARERGGITVIVSHRFSTVRMADLIVVLDKGRVVEVGSHDMLCGANGLYAELFALQARGYR